MKTSNWKIYKSLCTPKTYYITVSGCNWNAKVIEQFIAGTNFKNAPLSKKAYTIIISDGYKDVKIKFYSEGLLNSKKAALKMLQNNYNTYCDTCIGA